jgi:hypothetical protein
MNGFLGIESPKINYAFILSAKIMKSRAKVYRESNL